MDSKTNDSRNRVSLDVSLMEDKEIDPSFTNKTMASIQNCHCNNNCSNYVPHAYQLSTNAQTCSLVIENKPHCYRSKDDEAYSHNTWNIHNVEENVQNNESSDKIAVLEYFANESNFYDDVRVEKQPELLDIKNSENSHTEKSENQQSGLNKNMSSRLVKDTQNVQSAVREDTVRNTSTGIGQAMNLFNLNLFMATNGRQCVNKHKTQGVNETPGAGSTSSYQNDSSYSVVCNDDVKEVPASVKDLSTSGSNKSWFTLLGTVYADDVDSAKQSTLVQSTDGHMSPANNNYPVSSTNEHMQNSLGDERQFITGNQQITSSGQDTFQSVGSCKINSEFLQDNAVGDSNTHNNNSSNSTDHHSNNNNHPNGEHYHKEEHHINEKVGGLLSLNAFDFYRKWEISGLYFACYPYPWVVLPMAFAILIPA